MKMKRPTPKPPESKISPGLQRRMDSLRRRPRYDPEKAERDLAELVDICGKEVNRQILEEHERRVAKFYGFERAYRCYIFPDMPMEAIQRLIWAFRMANWLVQYESVSGSGDFLVLVPRFSVCSTGVIPLPW